MCCVYVFQLPKLFSPWNSQGRSHSHLLLEGVGEGREPQNSGM